MYPPNRLQPTEKYVSDAAAIEDGDGPVFQAHRRLLRRLAMEPYAVNPGILRWPLSRKEEVDSERYLWMSGYARREDDATVIELRGLRLCQKGVTVF